MEIRQKSIEKIGLLMRELLKNQCNATYSPYSACSNHKVSPSTILAMENLQLIVFVGSNFYCTYKLVEPILARKVSVERNKILYKYKEVETKEVVKIEETKTISSFDCFTDQDLAEELKKRGYLGTLNKSTTISL